MEDQRFITRRPRHEVQRDVQCHLTLIGTESDDVFEGFLGDLSRHGLKIITNDELPRDLVVRVQADLPTGLVQITNAATIRWSKLEDDGRWVAGLVFQRELSWEVMGEMFLSGILSLHSGSGFERPQSV